MQVNPFTSGKRKAKPLLKVSISFAAAVVLFTAAVAYSKGNDSRISFHGYLQGHENDTPQGAPPDSISVDGDVKGIATHLSEFQLTYKVTVKLPDGSATGSAELTAADGDRIFVSVSGQGEPTDSETPNLNSIVELDRITGGTGQFEGAKGSFTVKRLVDLATGFTSGSVQGTISLAGGRHPGH